MSPIGTVKVLGISGSLRKGSYNTAAIMAAAELMPADMVLDMADIGDLPLYNDDIRAAGYPPEVQRFRTQIAEADAILFGAAEFNFSISGVLKNAIDWASRPPTPPFTGKPFAVIGAATGPLGTGRAQYQLRHICAGLDMFAVNKPEVFINFAATKFDADGKLTDQTARDLIGQLMVALHNWTRRLHHGALAIAPKS